MNCTIRYVLMLILLLRGVAFAIIDEEIPTVPPAPTSITYPSTNANGSYTVTWGASFGAYEYILEEKFNSGAWTMVDNTLSSDPRSTSFTAKPAGSYVYRVAGCSDGCSLYRTGATLTVSAAAPTVSITASPQSISSGASSSLTWTSNNATACTLNNAAVALSGTQSTGSLLTSTTYSLTCTGAGSSSAQTTVTVLPAPTIQSFSASPSSIATGSTTTLTWATTFGSGCTLDGLGVPTSGSQVTAALTVGKTFTLQCLTKDSGDSKTASVKVVPAPTVTFSANPTSVALGGNSTLTWTSANATSCTLDTVAQAVSGSIQKSGINATKTYSLTCSGVGGSKTATATISVGAVPSMTFTATPNPVALNATTSLSWTTQNASSCTLNNVSVPVSLTQNSAVLSATTAYTLICTGVGGTETGKINVVVGLGWQNSGLCDPATGNQRQICTNGSLCTLDSVRDVPGMCSQALDCNQ